MFFIFKNWDDYKSHITRITEKFLKVRLWINVRQRWTSGSTRFGAINDYANYCFPMQMLRLWCKLQTSLSTVNSQLRIDVSISLLRKKRWWDDALFYGVLLMTSIEIKNEFKWWSSSRIEIFSILQPASESYVNWEKAEHLIRFPHTSLYGRAIDQRRRKVNNQSC